MYFSRLYQNVSDAVEEVEWMIARAIPYPWPFDDLRLLLRRRKGSGGKRFLRMTGFWDAVREVAAKTEVRDPMKHARRLYEFFLEVLEENGKPPEKWRSFPPEQLEHAHALLKAWLERIPKTFARPA